MLPLPLPALEPAVLTTWQPHAERRSSDHAYPAMTVLGIDESMVGFRRAAAVRRMSIRKPMGRGVQLPLNGPSNLAAYNDSLGGVDCMDIHDDLCLHHRQWQPELVLR